MCLVTCVQLLSDLCWYMSFFIVILFFFQAEDGIRDLVRSRGLGDVYKRQGGLSVRRCLAEPAATRGRPVK